MFNKLSGFAASVLGILILSCAALGQVTTGTILGTVHDSTGAIVPEATVTITDTTKGTVSVYKSDANGDYNAPFLIPGTYTVSVEKTGFKRSVSNNVVLDVDQHARVDVVMEVGQVSDTVQVTASTPLIRLDSAEMGEVVGKTQVQDLPLNGRDFAQLVYLVPGVTPGQAGENLSGSSSFNPRAASNFNALGSQANSSAWVVDGIDDNEWTFNTVMVQPSVESIAEFKVLTGTYSAEFGRGSGVVSVSTRSGSNAFHGEIFDYLRNSWMDARNYFNPNGSNPALPFQKQPAYRRNQFGAAVGGPIIKDKVFFFGDYYGQRSLKGIVNLNSVPTAAERTGDFSNYLNATTGKLIKIYNPFVAGRPQFSYNGVANVIPPQYLSQVGLNVASIYPLPTSAGSFNNYTSAANQIIDDNGGNGRIDYRISDKDSAFGRFSYERFIQTAPNPLVGGQGTCCLATPASAAKQFDLGPQVAGVQDTTLVAQGLALNETHIFNAGLVNEFRAGYARTNPFTTQSDFGHQSATSLGIQGVNVTQYATGLPNIQIGGSCGAEFTCLQGGTAFLPAHPVQTNIQVEDAISWTRGRHQLKFGFRYIKQMASPFTNTTTRGQFTFNDTFTDSPVDASGGAGLAALLIGFPVTGSRNYLQETYFVTDGEWAGYAVDDWKASPKLTVNLGLRYEVYTPETERENRLANFNFNTLSFIYAGQNGVDRHAGMQTRYGDAGPRLGFAYDVSGTGKTVIRGGYGITFFPLPYSASDELGQNPPYTVSQTFSENPNPTTAQFMTPCTSGNLGSNCLIAINNPFPQGVTTVPPSVTTNTKLLNAAAPAIISHQLSNPTPNMQMWNLNIERQLTASGLLELAYAGSHSIHLTFAYNPNEVEPGTPGVNSAPSTASRRLIQPLNNISTWVQEDEINASNYNSFQAKFTKRYGYGLTGLVAYTYSKSLDYGGSAASGGYSAGNPQTVTCLKCGYGASGFDQKHRFVASVAYELPFGAGKAFATHGPAAWALGGWEVDGIVTVGTGNPFTVTLNSGVNFGAPSWPNRIAKGTLPNPKQWAWFNTAAFVAPPFNTYGNSARSVLYGPGIANADLSLQRTIKLKESVSLALRGDSFNAFNHPNFLNPNSAIGSSTAGVISGTNLDNRDMQVSAKIVF